MGQRELIDALRREGEERCAAILGESGAESARMRAEAAAGLELLRSRHERQRERLCADRRREILAAATREAQLIRLRAGHTLAGRLRERARICLACLRTEGYERLFAGLKGELDQEEWAEVRVNPSDRELAARHFPQAAIALDPAIVGGFEAVTHGGLLTVVNTLERRLDRAWPDMLPDIVAEFGERMAR